jgi:hypothetical protein
MLAEHVHDAPSTIAAASTIAAVATVTGQLFQEIRQLAFLGHFAEHGVLRRRQGVIWTVRPSKAMSASISHAGALDMLKVLVKLSIVENV